MKAKQYAQMFEENKSMETLIHISTMFINECADIAKTRNAKSNSAMIAILNEQDLKWKALARLIDGVKPDGFEKIVKLQLPEVYAYWKGK